MSKGNPEFMKYLAFVPRPKKPPKGNLPKPKPKEQA